MRKIVIFTSILMLSGCHLVGNQTGKGPVTPPDGSSGAVITPPEDTDQGNIVIPPPVKKVDWGVSLEALVEQVVKSAVINKDDTLLVDNIKNNSNVEQKTLELTTQLKQTIGSTQRFTLVPEPQLDEAKQALGLQDQDSLNTRNKSIALARHLTAPYILYTRIDGNDLDLTLSAQIMQVQTGELIWSEKTRVKVSE